MGNPIQYRNTDNKGGFVKRLQYAPWGVPRGGFNENLTPASEASQRENKNSRNKMLPPVSIEPGPLTPGSKSNTLLSGLTSHLLVRLRL